MESLTSESRDRSLKLMQSLVLRTLTPSEGEMVDLYSQY